MDKYYFEVLPLHPLPEPQESLSSYVNRLMYINRLTRNDFACLVGCKNIFKDTVAVDYGVGRFEELSSITDHSRALLARTTLEEFMAKFARTTIKDLVKSFLEDVFVPYQRYCPACLKEKPVYKLPWRFNSLKCCMDHGCKLYDTCGHCGSYIEFLKAENGICSTCGKCLGACEIVKVDTIELTKNKREWDNISYLLAQREHPDPYLRLRLVRQLLNKVRETSGLSIAEMATRIERKIDAVGTNAAGKLILNHKKYKYYEVSSSILDYTISDIFRIIDQFFIFENQRYRFSDWAIIESHNDNLRRVYMIAQNIKSGVVITMEKRFKSALGLDYDSVRNDPIAAMLMDNYTRRWY